MVGEILRLAFKAVRAVWRGRVEHFWLIWTTMTVASAICAAMAVWRAATPVGQREPAVSDTDPRTQRSIWHSSLSALTLLALFLACYIALMLKWENFAYYDNSALTYFSLRGVDYPPPIWQEQGRFFPLGHQEFNLIRYFTKSIIGYQALPIVQLLIVSCILLILDKKLSTKGRVGLIVLLLVTPGFVISFGGLIYPERNIMFCLVCLLLFVDRFEHSRRAAWAVAAAVSAQIMIYEKETAFLLVLGFAIGRLVLACWNHQQGVWQINQLRRKQNRLYACLALLTIPFLPYYAAVMHPRPKMYYNAESRLSMFATCISYVKLDLLAWLFLIFALGRTYQILRRRTVPSPFWDGLALGGLLYFTAYLYLGLSSAYYLTPVNLIAVLYMGRFVILAWTHTGLWQRLAVGTLSTVVLLQSVSLSAICLFQRKNLLHAKGEIARVLDERHQAGKVHRLFFPFANPYVLNEFAAYLSYRGIPIKRATIESAGPNCSVIVARSMAKDGPCVPSYLNFLCRASSRPETGDLVIVLPDDNASFAEVLPYRNPEELIFSYQPSPHVPQWLGPIVRRIHIASPLFYPFGPDVQGSWPHTELPDRWLDASVAVWSGKSMQLLQASTR